jgi:DNA-binding CsgD family transcriptional regulator
MMHVSSRSNLTPGGGGSIESDQRPTVLEDNVLRNNAGGHTEDDNFLTGAVRPDRGANLQEQTPSADRNKLSPQEKKLLRRFAKDMTDEQIAREFGCRASLIAAQRQAITEKLKIRSPAQFAAAADQFAYWSRNQAGAQK